MACPSTKHVNGKTEKTWFLSSRNALYIFKYILKRGTLKNRCPFTIGIHPIISGSRKRADQTHIK